MTPLSACPSVLLRMLRDPIGTMRRPLDYSWPLIIGVLAVSALVSGGIAGAITHNILDFWIGLLVFPVTSIVTSFIFGAFIYYFFSLFQSTFLDFRRLMSVVSTVLVPYFLFHAVSSYLAPIDLLGFAFTAILLIVGLVEQFGLNRKTCTKLVIGLSVLFFVMWSAAQIKTATL